MRVIVTGGSGHIGQAVCSRFAALGWEVVNLDVKHVKQENVTWLYTDLTDKYQVVQSLRGADGVVHLGEMPGVHGNRRPEEVFAHNTAAGSNVMQTCVDLGIRRIAYASTCQTYGCWGEHPVAPIALPITEEHPLRPQNAYAASKVANEEYARILASHEDVAIMLMRIPSVFHPWYLRWMRARPRDFREARDGMATYASADDVAYAAELWLRSDRGGAEAYNLASPNLQTSVATREYMAAAYPDYPPVPDEVPEFGSLLSTRKVQEHLGWEAKFDISDVLSEPDAVPS